MDTDPKNTADRETVTLRELQALQQALTHLITVEQRLLGEQAALNEQINTASRQAYQAQQAHQLDQHSRAMDQRATALAAHTTLQEQLVRLGERKAEIARQQHDLQSQLSALQATQRQDDLRLREWLAQSPASIGFPAQPPPLPRRARKRLLWLTGLTVIVLVLASIGVAWHLKQESTAHPTTHPITLSKDNQPFYHSSGDLPSNQYCIDHFHRYCLSPEVIQSAFRLNTLYRSGYDGRGQTILIMGSGHTTTLQADVQHFDQIWGLPDPDLTILELHGPPTPYVCPGGRDLPQEESTLDVEWAHAIAPGGKIVLLIGDNHAGEQPEENCTGDLTLLEDIDYATTHHLGQILSISFGVSELGQRSDTASTKAALQRFFQQGHILFQQAVEEHISIIAATGDDGATIRNDVSQPDSYWSQPTVSWPASDPNVLAVGGTTLHVDATSEYQREEVWNDPQGAATGGGRSAVYAEPDYQHQVPNQAFFQGQRGLPDVVFPADGFLLYNASSTAPGLGKSNPQWKHWQIVGGTSASAPCWAGLVAIANQMRGQALGLIQTALYSMQGKGMHDITTGDNSLHGVKGYQAQPGFDLASGWGTPIADQFLPALIQAAAQS